MNRKGKDKQEAKENVEFAIGREMTPTELTIFDVAYYNGRENGIREVEDEINGFC